MEMDVSLKEMKSFLSEAVTTFRSAEISTEMESMNWGIYRDGTWKFDLNGDRHFDSVDEVFQHGKAGDRPVVGDFDGDGIDDIAVYRANKAG